MHSDFYKGWFGPTITVYLLFSAFLVWHLGSLAGASPQVIGALGWAFFLVQVACLALSWICFSTTPAAFFAVVAICLGCAAWLVQSA